MNIWNLINYYKIKKSGLFDERFYLFQNPDVRRADIDPLKHFIHYGAKENRSPNPFFSPHEYHKKYPELEYPSINLFLHYLKMRTKLIRTNGVFGKRKIQTSNPIKLLSNKFIDNDTSLSEIQNFIEYFNKELYEQITPLPVTEIVDIVICVGPKSQHITDCLQSIRKHSQKNTYQIHLIVHVEDYKQIKEFEADHIQIHTHDMELFNYARANNLVLKNCKNDVILLNDDTEVSSKWIEKLQKASKGVALTGAHTGFQCAGNPDMYGEGPTQTTNYTINMFCAYIPRRVLEVVGLLDETYEYYGGEDTDYSCRVRQNGFPLVISDAFVIHKDNQSFKETKNILIRETFKLLKENYDIEPPLLLDKITPKISIIMATYNRAHLIEGAIKNIQNVIYHDYEIIIVDDCSTDSTADLLVKIQNKYQNVKIILLSKNSGSTIARKNGLQVSTGQFVLFTDDDDLILPNRILSPLRFITKNPSLDVVYCNFNSIYDNGVKIPFNNNKFNKEDYLQLESIIIGSGILFGRRAAFVNVPFFSMYDRAVDYDWVFRLIRRGYKIELCPEIVMNYNRTGSGDEHLSGNVKSIELHKEIKKRELFFDNIKRKRDIDGGPKESFL